MILTVKSLNGPTTKIQCTETTTVEEIQKKVASQHQNF